MEYDNARRVQRLPLIIDIVLTDARSGIQIKARTKDLSLFGCSVDTLHPFPKGTHVRIKLSHRGANVYALARGAYARPDLGMGLVITNVEAGDERILGNWIAELMSRIPKR